jgi:dihydrofolate reductase
MQMTVDGFIAGPNGEMDWVVWNWDDKLKEYVTELTEPFDCIVLGRKLAEGFIPHWASAAGNTSDPEHTAGIKFTETHKVVFTKTLTTSPWPNTILATGNLTQEINALKNQPITNPSRNDIIAYGGGTFVSALIKHELIDDFHLFINPVAIGKGMAIFQHLEKYQSLKLVNSTPFECGIVVLHYQRA